MIVVRRLLLGLVLVVLLTGCGKNVDEKITEVRKGMSVAEVIELLGKPDEAWGSPIDDKIAFVYEGSKPYSILLYGNMVLDIHEGRLGGPNAVPLNQKVHVVVRGNRIEFRR